PPIQGFHHGFAQAPFQFNWLSLPHASPSFYAHHKPLHLRMGTEYSTDSLSGTPSSRHRAYGSPDISPNPHHITPVSATPNDTSPDTKKAGPFWDQPFLIYSHQPPPTTTAPFSLLLLLSAIPCHLPFSLRAHSPTLAA